MKKILQSPSDINTRATSIGKPIIESNFDAALENQGYSYAHMGMQAQVRYWIESQTRVLPGSVYDANFTYYSPLKTADSDFTFVNDNSAIPGYNYTSSWRPMIRPTRRAKMALEDSTTVMPTRAIELTTGTMFVEISHVGQGDGVARFRLMGRKNIAANDVDEYEVEINFEDGDPDVSYRNRFYERTRIVPVDMNAASGTGRTAYQMVFDHKITASGGVAPVVSSDTNQAFNTSATSYSVAMPVTVNSGDLLLVIMASDAYVNFRDNISATGWTKIDTTPWSAGGMPGAVFLYKVADGTEGGTSVLFGFSPGLIRAVAKVFCIEAGTWGGNPATDIAINSVAANNLTNPPLLTTTWTSTTNLFFAIFQGWDSQTFSGYPAGYTNTSLIATSTARTRLASGRKISASATDDPGNFSVTGGFDSVFTLGVKGAEPKAFYSAYSSVQEAALVNPSTYPTSAGYIHIYGDEWVKDAVPTPDWTPLSVGDPFTWNLANNGEWSNDGMGQYNWKGTSGGHNIVDRGGHYAMVACDEQAIKRDFLSGVPVGCYAAVLVETDSSLSADMCVMALYDNLDRILFEYIIKSTGEISVSFNNDGTIDTEDTGHIIDESVAHDYAIAIIDEANRKYQGKHIIVYVDQRIIAEYHVPVWGQGGTISNAFIANNIGLTKPLLNGFVGLPQFMLWTSEKRPCTFSERDVERMNWTFRYQTHGIGNPYEYIIAS